MLYLPVSTTIIDYLFICSIYLATCFFKLNRLSMFCIYIAFLAENRRLDLDNASAY